MIDEEALKILSVTEYNLLANKDPFGSYDRSTRKNLSTIISKLHNHSYVLGRLEKKLHKRFYTAEFKALEEKDRRVKMEVARYRLSSRAKKWAERTTIILVSLVLGSWFLYQHILSEPLKQQIDSTWLTTLNRAGLVSKEEVEIVKQNLTATVNHLQKTKEDYDELAQTFEGMIRNNKITENLKYIVKQTHNDSRTLYKKVGDQVVLNFDDQEIARFATDPDKWYLLGIIDSGLLRVYHDDEEVLSIEAIFGRKGEETPLGEYTIKNKVYKPTWYKKENVRGKTKVRVIPFGDPEHEIGHWWLGMKKLGKPVRGSYGIHGVNASKVNEFFKKNFDWRNGSAGCLNIQGWFLNFLAKVIPKGTRINIVQKDKWAPTDDV